MGVCIYRTAWTCALVCVLGAGCGTKPQHQACMNLGPGPLVSGAEVLHLQVFGGEAHCQGPTVAAGAPAPQLARSFGQGQPIELQLPPGHYVFLLTTFADLAETMAMGQGCSEATVEAGAQVCFDLTLEALPGHGGECLSDYACVGMAGGTCCANRCAELAVDVANCGGCGVSCETSHSLGPSCQGGAGCQYAGCAPERVDCNQQPPNADGCECAGTACCPTANGAACQSRHDNGVGGHFYDCVALDTYDGDQAGKAYDAATNFSGGPLILTCVGGSSADQATALCKTGMTSCVCWWYTGMGGFAYAPGRVSVNPNDGSCPCPDAQKDARWH